jgi:large subunit ribosomal protein L4
MAAKTVSVDLPAEIFDVEVNIPLIHQVVVAQQAAARQGTHATKTRGNVRGGGRKPYKQKGTGRARQGSTRAPQFAGGGTVHGPQPRSYDRGALSDRARNGRIHVVDSLVSGDKPSTRSALGVLAGLSDRARYLVVLERTDSLTWLSLRNAGEVHIVAVDQLNTYDVIAADDVVFTRGAYDAFVGKASGATPAEKPATAQTTATTDEPELPAGAKAPLKSARAPKGYEVLGKESGIYLLEDDAGYDAAAADFWFKSVEDAEAAGLTRADEKETDQ